MTRDSKACRIAELGHFFSCYSIFDWLHVRALDDELVQDDSFILVFLLGKMPRLFFAKGYG
jgi:hypothetical protein